ncbi:MAG: hypothetical protein Q9219_006457 [cf. Caloplaca sp. 3 TL-2023]
MAAERSGPYAVATGNNYGGVTAGQINIANEPDQTREKIISWLSPLNFRQKQDDVFSDAQEGTGQWFLKSKAFRNWFKGQNVNLWCHGAPGSGKTVLSSIVVNYLIQHSPQDKRIGVAVVYCELKQQNVQTVVNLLASIWAYLVATKPLTQDVQALYNRHTKLRTAAKLEEVLSVLKNAIADFSRVYIVVDALDELSQEIDRAQILMKSLSRLNPEKSNKIRILATSRFSQPLLLESSSMLITAAPRDVNRFVQRRIDNGLSISDNLSDNVRNDENLRKTLVDAITKQASGLDLAVRVLSWLFYAVGTMHVQELRHALAVRDADQAIDVDSLDAEDLFLSCCHGFVSIERKTEVVGLVHSTVQQYFNDNQRFLFPDGQTKLLRTCLTYLSFKEFRRGRCQQRLGRSANISEAEWGPSLADRLGRFPFLRYAGRHWGHHAAGKIQSIYENSITSFLRDPMLLESAAQIQINYIINDCLVLDKLADEDLVKYLPVYVAVLFGLDHIVDVLLDPKKDSNVNVYLKYGGTKMLYEAIRSNNESLIRVLLKRGADASSVFHNAVILRRHAIVDVVLSLSQHDVVVPRAIYCATFHENFKAIKAMINNSRDGTKRKQRSNQFLHHAACLGRTSVVQFAVSLGADLEAKDRSGRTAIFLAVTYGRLQVLKWLLKCRVSTTVRDSSGNSLLQAAVSTQEIFEERLRLIRYLGYADVPVQGTGSMERPMVYKARFFEAIRMFTKYEHESEDYWAINKFDSLIFDDNERFRILKMLLPYADDINERDSDGRSLLHRAVYTYPEGLRVLLEGYRGRIVIDSRDNNGRTPLHYAVVMDRWNSMRELLEHGADIAAKDRYDATVLHFSIKSISCTDEALKYGASVKAEDAFCRTAIHYAALAEKPNSAVIDLLVRAGMKSGIGDLRHMTAVSNPDQQPQGDSHNQGMIDWMEGMRNKAYYPHRNLYSALVDTEFFWLLKGLKLENK